MPWAGRCICVTGNTTWWGLYLTDAQQQHLEALERSHHARWCQFLVELHDNVSSEYPFVDQSRKYRNSAEYWEVPVRLSDELPPVSGEIEAR